MSQERPKPRYLMLWIPAVTAGLLALGLAVWGATHQAGPDDDQGGGPSSPSATVSSPSPEKPEPSATPSDVPAADAAAMLDDALERWREADTGTFRQTSVIPGIGRLRVTGVYELSTRSSEATQVFEPEREEPVEIRFAGTEGMTYLNSPDWGAELRPCWMRFDAEVLAESSAVVIVNGADSLPANVVALTDAQGVRVDAADPDAVLGTVPLADAVPLFGSGLLNALGDVTLDETVAARFQLADGELVGWRVSGRSMVTALRRAGAESELDGVVLAAVSSYAVDVQYDELGATEVDVRLPAPELRMTRAESSQGCPAVR